MTVCYHHLMDIKLIFIDWLHSPIRIVWFTLQYPGVTMEKCIHGFNLGCRPLINFKPFRDAQMKKYMKYCMNNPDVMTMTHDRKARQ
jgi:hypothetical protein